VACGSDPYPDTEKYGALRAVIATKDWMVTGAVERSGTPREWAERIPHFDEMDLVRKQPGPEKYFECNADESEPGTIKDRFIMTHLPHLLVEGMILAGLVTGAKQGILYIPA